MTHTYARRESSLQVVGAGEAGDRHQPGNVMSGCQEQAMSHEGNPVFDDQAVVHVIDDDASLREAVGRLLEMSGYKVRQYESAGEFLLSWTGDHPGCLLLDIRMPGPSGMDLQRALAQRPDSPPVVFLTGFADIPTSVRAIKLGAVDFLTKPVMRETLLPAVNAALARDHARRLSERRTRELQDCFATLTAREREVFVQVAAGRLNKQIAVSINTCERTVKAHRANVMQKLNAHSLAELVHIAVQLKATTADRPGTLVPA